MSHIADLVKSLLEDCDCPHCGGQGVLLGTLGKRVHFRCRDCGADFSGNAEDLEEGKRAIHPEFLSRDPALRERLLRYGKKSREERKAFKSGKREINRLKKEGK